MALSTRDTLRRRAQRVRSRIKQVSAGRPRLSVFRSAKHIYAQVIDDVSGTTLASASTMEKTFDGPTGSVEAAKKVGKLVGERAKCAGVETVVFDRGGNRYHGRVAGIADGAREAGLTL